MIFVHASFRSSSTYIWSHLRKAPRTVAYYEVFHEVLNDLTPDQIPTISPNAWRSGHPSSEPYFLEFSPLIRFGGGVFGFSPNMSYERFIPADGCTGPISEAETQYLSGLVSHAENCGRIPILTASRSLGRIRGIKAALPGQHLLIYRNLFQQWCSFTDQAFNGNSYFLDRISTIIHYSQHDPVIAELQTHFPMSAASYDDANTFYSFIFLHLHLYVQGAGAVDLIIDINRLDLDPSHRNAVEAALQSQDVVVDLSDVSPKTTYSLCQLGPPNDVEARLKDIAGLVLAHAPDKAGAAFGSQVMSDLVEEYRRDTFYASGMRSILVGQQGVLSERDRLRADYAAMGVAKDNLDAQCSSIQAECDAAHVAHAALLTAKNELQLEREGLAATCDALRQENTAIQGSLIEQRDRHDLTAQALSDQIVGMQTEAAAVSARLAIAEAQNVQGATALVEAEARIAHQAQIIDEHARALREAQVESAAKIEILQQALSDQVEGMQIEAGAISARLTAAEAQNVQGATVLAEAEGAHYAPSANH